MDHCDQVQIDHVTQSRIFIGASSESIFIRNCKDCTFTVACKQLRTRDCSNCTIYLHCKTEPIIETSSNIQFGPFNGAYPAHDENMKAANLPVQQNLWYKVYDFNDEMKTGCNWSLLNDEEMEMRWCPLHEGGNGSSGNQGLTEIEFDLKSPERNKGSDLSLEQIDTVTNTTGIIYGATTAFQLKMNSLVECILKLNIQYQIEEKIQYAIKNVIQHTSEWIATMKGSIQFVCQKIKSSHQ